MINSNGSYRSQGFKRYYDGASLLCLMILVLVAGGRSFTYSKR